MNQLNTKGLKEGPWKEKGHFGYTYTLNYMNGKQHGLFEAYHLNVLEYKGMIKHNREIGFWKWYWKNGVVYKKEFYL